MVSLEGLILVAETEENRVLEIVWQHNVLVVRFAWHLHTEVPRHQRDVREGWWVIRTRALVNEVLRGVVAESIDGLTEGTRAADMLPRQRSKGGA